MQFSVDIFRHMVERSDEIICYHASDGRYLYATPALNVMLGYKASDIIYNLPSDFIHPSDLLLVQDHLLKLIQNNTDEPYVEYRIKRANGSYLWVKSHFELINDAEGRLVNFISYSVNITGLKKTLHQLAKSESLLIEAGRMSRIGVWELDLITNEVFWSRITYEIFELDPRVKPTIEKAWSFFTESSRKKLEALFDSAVNSGTPYDVTISIISAKNNHKWVRTIGKPEQESGKAVRIYGTFMDVTEQVAQEKQFEKTVQVLERQKKQLNEFNQIVSHNLRSPVSNLNVLLDYIEETEKQEQKEHFISLLRQVTNSLNSTLEDLVDVVKVLQNDNLPVENISISELMGKVEKQMVGQLKKLDATLKLDTSAWDEIPYSPIYMQSILSNLTSNALNYSDSCRKPNIEIQTFFKDEKKVLTFTDNGIGIDLKRHGKNIFKMQKTFHRHFKGKGIGLFMIKNQVEALDGSIEVTSKEGEGTQYTVYFNK